MKKIKIAMIGVGGRGEGLYRVALKFRNDIEIISVCDEYIDRCEYLAKELVADGHPQPSIFTDYKKCLCESKPEAVVIATSWEAHIKVSIFAMELGVAVACEVGGSYSLESLWELVRCYERTKTPIMMLENCCYGRLELLALNMSRMGLLGKILHCEGGYRHDLRTEIVDGNKNRHYRLQQYIHRNTENYPTHEIGPIAKILNINCGNRFLSLVSVGNKPQGLAEYVKDKNIEELKNVEFNQSDIVTTIIKCQNGETVTIHLDTCLPRYYSRDFMVQGTKGLICEQNQSVFLDKDFTSEEFKWTENYNNVKKYYEQYEHPIWRGFNPGEKGHGGMDALVFDGFFDALKNNLPMPVDVYDMATWMCISVLAEQSMATGQPVAFPDFTDGKWITNKNNF